MKVDLTQDESSVNVNGAERPVKHVLAGPQGVARAANQVAQQKRQAMP
jgi:hypothetical protein